MTYSNSHGYTARRLRDLRRGKPSRFWWSDEALAKLHGLIVAGASADDLSIAFDGLGISTLLTGARILIQEAALRAAPENPVDAPESRAQE
jgi:hypothetical protein